MPDQDVLEVVEARLDQRRREPLEAQVVRDDLDAGGSCETGETGEVVRVEGLFGQFVEGLEVLGLDDVLLTAVDLPELLRVESTTACSCGLQPR
ncbi:hypothetical protein OG604_15900 [Streptomyces sp. NBC_01231]|nr:hypothetical protein OG604_15900 [Streptomyces sp. NBC_01231]